LPLARRFLQLLCQRDKVSAKVKMSFVSVTKEKKLEKVCMNCDFDLSLQIKQPYCLTI